MENSTNHSLLWIAITFDDGEQSPSSGLWKRDPSLSKTHSVHFYVIFFLSLHPLRIQFFEKLIFYLHIQHLRMSYRMNRLLVCIYLRIFVPPQGILLENIFGMVQWEMRPACRLHYFVLHCVFGRKCAIKPDPSSESLSWWRCPVDFFKEEKSEVIWLEHGCQLENGKGFLLKEIVGVFLFSS